MNMAIPFSCVLKKFGSHNAIDQINLRHKYPEEEKLYKELSIEFLYHLVEAYEKVYPNNNRARRYVDSLVSHKQGEKPSCDIIRQKNDLFNDKEAVWLAGVTIGVTDDLYWGREFGSKYLLSTILWRTQYIPIEKIRYEEREWQSKRLESALHNLYFLIDFEIKGVYNPEYDGEKESILPEKDNTRGESLCG